jgi:N6-adenosine-specific RNA methylase IME4
LTVEELCRFPLPPLAPKAHLFLWRVAALQEEALQVVRAWGFVPKAELVWLKRTKRGKRWFGMGRQVRNEHEVCIIATRSNPSVRNKAIRSTFEAKVGRHSEKPDEFYGIVEELCERPYVELFARRRRSGWKCWGTTSASGFKDVPPA